MIANDAMDVQGGKGIILGPKNYIGRGYQAIPIAITVEGANILTRSLIIYGQGAIRCHPFVLKEMEAATNENHEQGLADFDTSLFGHIGYAFSNMARSFVMAMTHAKLSLTPQSGPVSRYYQHINRYSAAFALASDIAMLNLGGELKRRESLSARLGDVFSSMYLASMVLKQFEDQGRPDDDLPIVEWACRSLLYQAQEQLHSFLRNFPNRFLAAGLRILIFPRGRTYSAPADELSWKIVDLITYPTESRERLCAGIYSTTEPSNPLGLLQEALEATEAATPLENKLRDARRAGVIGSDDPLEMIEQAEQEGVLTADEAAQLKALDEQVMALIEVDDFAPEELRAGTA
jgi:acyl-CoA dehydrogenase